MPQKGLHFVSWSVAQGAGIVGFLAIVTAATFAVQQNQALGADLDVRWDHSCHVSTLIADGQVGYSWQWN